MKTLMIALGLMLNASIAMAAIPTGYFTGNATTETETKEVRVWIKTVQKSKTSATSYGLILMKDAPQAALFRVEQLPDGTLTWTELFESDKHVLTQPPSAEATYMGEAFQLNSKESRLTIIPTDFGKRIGCKYSIEVETDSGIDWVNLPSKAVRYEGEKKSKLDVNSTVVSGTFVLNGERITGNFRLTEIFPGLATLRAKVVSPDSADGRAEERRITAMVIMLKRKRFIISDVNNLVLLKLNNLSERETCWSGTNALED